MGSFVPTSLSPACGNRVRETSQIRAFSSCQIRCNSSRISTLWNSQLRSTSRQTISRRLRMMGCPASLKGSRWLRNTLSKSDTIAEILQVHQESRVPRPQLNRFSTCQDRKCGRLGSRNGCGHCRGTARLHTRDRLG